MPGSLKPHLEDALRRGYVAAFRILGNSDESHDACQEAVARALAAKDRYDPTQPFYPWFYRILKNHCLDRLKRKKRTTPAGDTVEAVPDAKARSTETTLMLDERSRAVSDAIGRLPEDLGEIIELRHFQDLSYEEMATVLQIPTGTVMSRLYRARKKLRELLEGTL